MIDARVVSRKLGQKFTRSKTHTTRVRGWHNTTSGFVVTQAKWGVLVQYESGSWKSGAVGSKEEMLDAMYNFLIEQGFNAQVTGSAVVVVEKELVKA